MKWHHVVRIGHAGAWAIALSVFASAVPSQADELFLRDGTVVSGKYVGGTPQAVKLQTEAGVLEVAVDQIKSINFAAPPPPPPPKPEPTPAPAPVPQAAVGPATIPAGTLILVKMASQVTSNDKAGERFNAQLVGDLTDASGASIVKAGTMMFGRVGESKQAGRMVGKSKLALTLSEIDLDGKLVPIVTTNFVEAGKGSFRKTARNAAAGAAIGAAFDDAAAGAAIGAGTALIRKGDSVTVPIGAMLEFRLAQPLTLTPAP